MGESAEHAEAAGGRPARSEVRLDFFNAKGCSDTFTSLKWLLCARDCQFAEFSERTTVCGDHRGNMKMGSVKVRFEVMFINLLIISGQDGENSGL